MEVKMVEEEIHRRKRKICGRANAFHTPAKTGRSTFAGAKHSPPQVMSFACISTNHRSLTKLPVGLFLLSLLYTRVANFFSALPGNFRARANFANKKR